MPPLNTPSETMKIQFNATVWAVLLLLNLNSSFAQKSPDNIIFLTDLYTSFIHKAEAGHKNVDSLYKESLQTSIYDSYFQKSEYAFIVKDFFASPIKNTAELKKSIESITLNRELIKTNITRALKKSRQLINADSLTIYIIPANPESRPVIESMMGIMGLTAGSKQIILTIEPGITGWEKMLEYAVAHEFNHAYWTSINFGKSEKWTLLNYLVFEGRGDYFAHLLYPAIIAPWTTALTEKQKTELWANIKPHLQSEDFSYQMEVMFGSGKYPVWGGYSIGYDIVLTALANNKKLTADTWTNLEADKLLELSKYK